MFKTLKKNMQEMMSSPKKEENKKFEFSGSEIDAHLESKKKEEKKEEKDLSKEQMGKRIMPEEQKEHIGDSIDVETIRDST